MTLFEALCRYIVRGGENWMSTWHPNWIPFLTFLLVATYNFARMALLWKTKRLETQEVVTNLPVRF